MQSLRLAEDARGDELQLRGLAQANLVKMTPQLAQGIVSDSPRRAIYVVRILDAILDYTEIDDVAEQMRRRVLSRYGEQDPNIVVVQGDSKETLRLFGDVHAVTLVRTALFNAAVRWSPLQLD